MQSPLFMVNNTGPLSFSMAAHMVAYKLTNKAVTWRIGLFLFLWLFFKNLIHN